MDASLIETLAHTGLNEKQAATYVALLELGTAPASKIAQRTNINRSVTYELLEELLASGHITEQPHTKVRQFTARDPQGIFESARAHFENLRFFLPVLRTLHASGHTHTTMQVFEGKEAVSRLFQAHDDASERCFISSFADMELLFPEEFTRWARRTAQVKHPTPTRFLLTDDAAGRAYAKSLDHIPNQEFRFFATGTSFKMDVSLIQDTIMIVSFDPICAVVIRSAAMAHSARTLFSLLWKQAKT